MEFLIAPFIAIWAMLTIPVHHAAWKSSWDRHHWRSLDYPVRRERVVAVATCPSSLMARCNRPDQNANIAASSCRCESPALA